jgi:hypothetical protein
MQCCCVVCGIREYSQLLITHLTDGLSDKLRRQVQEVWAQVTGQACCKCPGCTCQPSLAVSPVGVTPACNTASCSCSTAVALHGVLQHVVHVMHVMCLHPQALQY